VKNFDRAHLRSILNELVQEQKLFKKGRIYSLNKTRFNVLKGEIDFDHNERFVIRSKTPNGQTEYYRIKSSKSIKLATGDKVEFIVTKKKKKGIGNAKLIKVISKENIFVTGTFDQSSYHGFVIPDSKIFKKDIFISKRNFNMAKNRDKVVCEIINSDDLESGYDEPEGKIKEVLGKAGEIDVELKSVLKKYGLKTEFPKNVIKQSEEIKFHSDLNDRIDLREKVCFTIDPEDAKDFDDAVSIELLQNKEYKIGIHIADVSYYVKENTDIDIEALKRGTSYYLVNHVVPMLPEKLSNDICSLKPNEDRLTFSVFITLNKNCEIQNYEIRKSIINSKRRFTYEEVQKIVDTKKGDFSKEILKIHDISKQLTKIRMEEESIDFETQEVKFVLDEEGKVKDIKLKQRLDSMRLIEEYMLLANKCVTEFVTKLKKKKNLDYPFIYRVHDDPDADKLKDLSEYVKQFGYTLNVNDKNSIKELLKQIKGKPEEFIINNLLIRSMAKAIYTDKNIGHYGLGFPDYTHFTSPIRRYPDLIVHRMLYDYIKEPEGLTERINNYRKIIRDVSKQCSTQEQNAVSAERETIKLKQIEYLNNHIGDEFEGIISGIIKNGIFVEISELYIEGMVRFKDIEDDYYEYDIKNHCAVGLRKHKMYRAGDKVNIKVISTDMATKKIDFVFV